MSLYLLFCCLGIIAGFSLIVFLLHNYKRKKGIFFPKHTILDLCLLAIIFIVVPIYQLGFSEKFGDFVFDCQKETQRCDHYYSTPNNEKLRLKKSYDLAGINNIELVTRVIKSKSGLFTSGEKYYLKFYGASDSFEMPREFILREEAEKQAGRIAKFLNTRKSRRYTYKKMVPEELRNDVRNRKETIIIVATLVFSIFALIVSILMILEIFFPQKKK